MHNIKTMPKYLNWILFVSLVYVFLHIICFDNMSEPFSYAHELGELLYKIFLSIIASYIFYFIVVHLKQERDKLNINIFVENEVDSIIKKHKLEINFKEQKKNSCYGADKKLTIEIVSIIKNIFLVMPFLDTELVKILSKILNSKYCLSVTMYNEVNGGEASKDLNRYKKLHDELKEYYDLKLVQYRKDR